MQMAQPQKNDQLNQLLNTLSKKLGTDPQSLKSAAQSGDVSKTLKGLKPEDAQKVQRILNDKQATEKLLSSPQAQQLLKMLSGSGNQKK